MKVNDIFLQAKKDKNIHGFCLHDTIEQNERKQYISLYIQQKNKYTNEKQPIHVFQDTTIKYDDYSKDQHCKSNNLKTCFSELIYELSRVNHIKTFLNNIKKDSDVSFFVVAFNGSENLNKANMVNHSLYGIIDNKTYLLSYFVGLDNSASSINY